MSLDLAANRLIGALLDHPGEAHRMAPIIEAEAMPPGLAREAYAFLLRRHDQGGPSQPPIEPEELTEALVGAGINGEAAKSWVLHTLFPLRAGPETIKARAEDVRRLSYGAHLVSSLRDAAGMAERCLASSATYAEVRDEALRMIAAGSRAARAARSASAWEANQALLRRMQEAERAGGITGFTWDLPYLDGAIGGLRPGQLTVVAARMKVGKTHGAVHLAEHVAGREWPHLGRKASVLFFSFEMDEAEVRRRAIAWQTAIDSRELERGELRKDDWGRVREAIERTNGLDIQYITERGLGIEAIVDITRSRASEGPVDLAPGSRDRRRLAPVRGRRPPRRPGLPRRPARLQVGGGAPRGPGCRRHSRADRGGPADFHSLRVAFISSLARAGVPLAQAQKLARHCSPVLTATIYSRFGFDEDAAAIAKLPNLAGAAG